MVDGALATCPAGKVVVGSGFYGGITQTGFVESFNGTAVGGGFANQTSIAEDVDVQAFCAPGSVSAGVRTVASRGAGFEARLDQLRQQAR